MINKRIVARKRSGSGEAKKAARIANVPRLTYPEALPITAKKHDIVEAIRRHRVVVITGETGSGKTTQIPKMCLEAGRGIFGVIGCTQPRRVAAITVAHRIAEELGEDIGRSVGYQIRFEDRSGRNNYIKIMTDGILLNEAQNDPYLRRYDTIIVDEAHERSLNIDFVLGILRTLLRKRRDLKVIITSATIDTEKFSRAFHAPIIEVSGRMYPVEVRYQPLDYELEESGDITHVDAAVSAVRKLMAERYGGDILIFMPTEQDIRETCELIEKKLDYEAAILPLFARLPWTEQRRVFQPSSSRKIIVATNVAETSITIPGIKYVIDTGLARISQYNPRSRTTSLPVRDISKSSADQRKGRCGRVQNGVCIRLFEKADYEDRPLFTEPEILRSNLAEVILRMLSLRLGEISSFPFIDPPPPKSIRDGIEILKELGAIEAGRNEGEGLDSRLRGNDGIGGKDAGLDDIEGILRSFDKLRTNSSSLDPPTSSGQTAQDDSHIMAREHENHPPLAPPVKGGETLSSFSWREGLREGETYFRTNDIGKREADKELKRKDEFLDSGVRRNDGIGWNDKEGTEEQREQILLTERGRMMARLPIDPRISRMIIEAEKEGCVEGILIIAAALSIQDPRERPAEFEKEADKIHAGFADPTSDFMTLLRIWDQYHGLMRTVKSKNRMKKFCREHYLSFRRMREWGDVYDQIKSILDEQGWDVKKKETDDSTSYEGIHKSVLSGYLSNIASKKGKNIYLATKGKEVMIFPGSGLFNKGGSWIVSAEMIETSRLFARMAANIKVEWLEELGGSLCRSTYSEPHWSRDRGEVVAFEQVTLFGLVIVPKRPVSYGRINADEASEIFIRSALVEEDLKKPLPFLHHNHEVIERIANMEDKIRRRNLLASEDELASFYRGRLPGIYDVRTLQKLIRDRGSDGFLRMKEEDIMHHFPSEDEIALYPDEVAVGNHRLPLTYRFDPGKPEDGVTLSVPVHMVSALSGKSADWLIPGLLKEKIMALLKGLPKDFKKKLQPLSQSVDIIAEELNESEGFLLSAMGTAIFEKFGVDIPASSWNQEAVSDYLKVRYSVVDEKGREVSSGRDFTALQSEIISGMASSAFMKAQKAWEKSGLKEWSFGDLPEMIALGTENSPEGYAFPALVAGDGCVHIRLFKTKIEAGIAHGKGVRELYSIFFNNNLKYLNNSIVFKGELKRISDDMGLTKVLGKAIYERVLRDLFDHPVRTKEAFDRHANEVASKILPAGQDVLNRFKPLILAYHDIFTKIRSLEKINRHNRPALQYLEEIKYDLDGLIPPDFTVPYDDEKIADIIRYLKALTVRAERGLLHLEKAFQKTYEVKTYVTHFQNMVKDLSPQTSDAKRAAIEELRWMIEEYKVSVFAQEIKTAFPVSGKRLEKKIQEIERML